MWLLSNMFCAKQPWLYRHPQGYLICDFTHSLQKLSFDSFTISWFWSELKIRYHLDAIDIGLGHIPWNRRFSSPQWKEAPDLSDVQHVLVQSSHLYQISGLAQKNRNSHVKLKDILVVHSILKTIFFWIQGGCSYVDKTSDLHENQF